jgi:hypothetical protein
MKRNFLLLMIALTFSLFVEDAMAFSPSWTPGDSWTIEVRYARPLSPEKWSDPVYWKYDFKEAVEEEKPGFVLEARSMVDDKLGLRISFTKDMVPVKIAKIRKVGVREEIVETNLESGFPSTTSYSMAPSDFPVFPLAVPDSRFFEKVRPFGKGSDLRIKETVHQETRWIDEIPADERFELDRSLKNVVEVKVSYPDREVWFVQFWDPDLAWPLLGENNNMVYRLVLE